MAKSKALINVKVDEEFQQYKCQALLLQLRLAVTTKAAEAFLKVKKLLWQLLFLILNCLKWVRGRMLHLG
jgi:hypothetical protein